MTPDASTDTTPIVTAEEEPAVVQPEMAQPAVQEHIRKTDSQYEDIFHIVIDNVAYSHNPL